MEIETTLLQIEKYDLIIKVCAKLNYNNNFCDIFMQN